MEMMIVQIFNNNESTAREKRLMAKRNFGNDMNNNENNFSTKDSFHRQRKLY